MLCSVGGVHVEVVWRMHLRESVTGAACSHSISLSLSLSLALSLSLSVVCLLRGVLVGLGLSPLVLVVSLSLFGVGGSPVFHKKWVVFAAMNLECVSGHTHTHTHTLSLSLSYFSVSHMGACDACLPCCLLCSPSQCFFFFAGCCLDPTFSYSYTPTPTHTLLRALTHSHTGS